ncbi:adenylyl-sulfate kinase [Rubrolithibacter danxiaensis]|uniref:adenylyl-sulfate kinase n=1 Tax=Rubrolithibacter danxiaensis TaxID=3390805 RepID=UPI003BF8DACD
MLIIQFTGLSGAGKTTLACQAKKDLEYDNISLEIIDGDFYRQTKNEDLGFSKEDRKENVRRLALAATSFEGRRSAVIIAAINPYEEVRRELKKKYAAKTIWINCRLGDLLVRDTKGLYRRAYLPEGHPEKIYNLTGVNDPYEVPETPDLILNTHQETVAESLKKLCDFIKMHCSDSFASFPAPGIS